MSALVNRTKLAKKKVLLAQKFKANLAGVSEFFKQLGNFAFTITQKY